MPALAQIPYYLQNPASDPELAPPRIVPPAPVQDQGPPPEIPKAMMQATAEDQPMAKMPSAPQPHVSMQSPEQRNIDYDQAKLEKVRESEARPWGFSGAAPSAQFPGGLAPNHPGTMGKIAHVLSVAGNIAGNIVAPNVMANIPGTRANMSEQEGGLAKRLNTEISDESQNQERGAQTAHTVEQTAEAPQKAEDAHAQSEATVGNLDSETQQRNDAAANPTLVIGHAHAVNRAIQQGRDPASDPLVQMYEDAIQRSHPQANKGLSYQTVMGPDGKPHTYAMDEKGNKSVDEGVHYEKPTVINANAENNRADKSYQYNNGELDKLTNPISTAVQRMGRLQDTLAQGTPQADALVAPELMTVMAGGMGSGLRINEAEIARTIGGRSKWEGLKAAANQWSLDPKTANSITPEQRQEIHALVGLVNDKLMAKQRILDQASGDLIGTDDPRAHRTIVQKAKQALTAIDEGAGQGGGVVRARDPQGKLHEAPEGTALPAGWVKE